MKIFEKFLFGISFFVAFIGIIKLVPLFVSIVLVIALTIYLFSGWFLLLPEKGGVKGLPFFVSFLIAQSLLTVLFGINKWPFTEFISYYSAILLVITITVLFLYNKSLSKKYPINNFIVRLVICFMFSLSPLWMHIIN